MADCRAFNSAISVQVRVDAPILRYGCDGWHETFPMSRGRVRFPHIAPIYEMPVSTATPKRKSDSY